MVKWCKNCNDFREDKANFCGWCGEFIKDFKQYPQFKTLAEKEQLKQQIQKELLSDARLMAGTNKQLKLF